MKSEICCIRDIPKFRERIEQLRGNTTQEEFCKGIGINKRTYQYWLNGEYTDYNNTNKYKLPDIETAMRICDKYNVSLDYLFGRIDCETVSNQAIKDMIGIDDKGIAGLKDIKLQDDYSIRDEQPGLCVLPVLNNMLGVCGGEYVRQLLSACRDYLNTDYCVPVYHTGKGTVRNTKKHGKVLYPETIKSSSEMDIIKGHTIKDDKKTVTFPDTYIQHFARENDLYDNIPITITKEFLQAVALKELEQAIIQIKNSIENEKL